MAETSQNQTARLFERVSAAIDLGINGDPPHLLPGDVNDAAHAVLCEVADWLEEQARIKHPDRPSASVALLREEARRG